MSNLDITTLKEKLKNIPTPRPRTIEWCDECPTSNLYVTSLLKN